MWGHSLVEREVNNAIKVYVLHWVHSNAQSSALLGHD
jgi:hypothetical protein